ncbi:adhesin, partial [Pseudomonas fluorescens]
RVMLEIAAVQGEERFKAGDYHGTVHMIFEAMSP